MMTMKLARSAAFGRYAPLIKTLVSNCALNSIMLCTLRARSNFGGRRRCADRRRDDRRPLADEGQRGIPQAAWFLSWAIRLKAASLRSRT